MCTEESLVLPSVYRSHIKKKRMPPVGRLFIMVSLFQRLSKQHDMTWWLSKWRYKKSHAGNHAFVKGCYFSDDSWVSQHSKLTHVVNNSSVMSGLFNAIKNIHTWKWWKLCLRVLFIIWTTIWRNTSWSIPVI